MLTEIFSVSLKIFEGEFNEPSGRMVRLMLSVTKVPGSNLESRTRYLTEIFAVSQADR
jgi:hypothetical protein